MHNAFNRYNVVLPSIFLKGDEKNKRQFCNCEETRIYPQPSSQHGIRKNAIIDKLKNNMLKLNNSARLIK